MCIKTFDNIYNFVDYMPKYMIPYEYLDICWYLKIKNNSEFRLITPKEVLFNLQKIYGKFDNPKNIIIKNKISELKDYLQTEYEIRILRSGKIIYKKNSIPDNMIECDNCGKIWDGNAQCDCYLYSNEFGELLYVI